jgi:hypothetical protein
MASPETTAEVPEPRTCAKCSETKAVTPETWVYKKARSGRYEPHGNTCRACDRKRQAEYEARRDKIKALADAPLPADEKEAKAAAKLDVAKALRAGGKVLNEYAPSILARLLQYSEDPDHPLHQWALDKLVDRVLPRKLYEELGGQAAGVGGLNDKRPQYLIQVLPAQQAAPGGNVVEGEVRLVEVLPAPSTPE